MIPRPLRVTRTGAGARLSDGMVVAADEASRVVGDLLASEIEASTGWRVRREGPEGVSDAGAVRLRAGPGLGPRGLGNAAPGEGYRLTAGPGGVDIGSLSAAGVFWGTRTLRQLLPPELLRAAPPERAEKVEVAGLEVEDAPRFQWRGIGLDVSRHFFPKGFIMKLVDLASLHKLNVLHLHLTDDQGWRIEVERYPLLTEVGAWRRESPLGHYRERRKDGTPHGGFYTKADLAEIVAYAARRFVTVLPEVDMPGHMQAAIASYPELGNTPERLEVSTDWGISQHVLNLEQGAVRFCGEVLEEVMGVFPGRYVHIGGDECPTTEWAASPSAGRLCKANGLSGPGQMQGWFTAKMSKVISREGRALAGWDEVFDAGAPPGALVLAWREQEGPRVAVEAAQAGHDVVMALEPWSYFDWSYADDPAEPLAIRPAISVEKAYSFEPVPTALDSDLEHHILGAQCELWTEYVAHPSHAEYMYFPRVCATAEVTWSSRERKWDEFEKRLRPHMARLGALGVNYRPLDGPSPGQARTWSGPARRTGH